MNRVTHFEVQVDDVARAKKFYEEAFGWQIEPWMTKEKDGMDYWGLMTGKAGERGINGGMYERPKDAGDKYYLYDCTIEVDDLDKAVESVKKAGGMITKEKDVIAGVGFFAGAKDTEGNRFGLMQSTGEMKEM